MYGFIFESPESSWDENWRKGEQILTNLVFSVDPSTNLAFSVDPPLPPDDVLQAKVLKVARAMGWALAYENRSEGLFTWRADLDCGAGRPIGCCFSWYMKRVRNEIWVDDPVQCVPLHGGSLEVGERLAAAVRPLQEDFKRRWFALVGPVTLRGPSPETHSSELQMRAMSETIRSGMKRDG